MKSPYRLYIGGLLLFALLINSVQSFGANAKFRSNVASQQTYDCVYEIDYSEYSSYPFFVMDYAPTIENGVMKSSNPANEDTGAYDGWYQYFIADNIQAVKGKEYKAIAKLKGSHAGTIHFAIRWSWEEDPTHIDVDITDQWQEVEVNFYAGGTNNWIIFQSGSYVGDLEWEWLKVIEKDSTPVRWENLLENGDASGYYGNVPCAYSQINGSWSRNAAGIVSLDGNRVFRVNAGDVEESAEAWANQFWIRSPQTFNTGDVVKISFRYKATQSGFVETFSCDENFDYIGWEPIGRIHFSTEWKTFSRKIAISENHNGIMAVGFNLNDDIRTATNFYFDDLEWSIEKSSPSFYPQSCSFYDPIEVAMTADEGWDIYYTTDETTPSETNGYKYTAPLQIKKTTIVNAIAIAPDGTASPVSSATYTCTHHAIGEDYKPSSPPDPNSSEEVRKLLINVNPTGAGYTNYSSMDVEKGKQYAITASAYSSFKFQNWTCDGEVVSTDRTYSFTMPDHNVALVANFTYSPSSPDDPDEPVLTHPVAVTCQPAGAGWFNFSSTSLGDGQTMDIHAYANNNFRFKGWKVDGNVIEQTSNPLNITMAGKPISVVGLYDYYPSSPSNPGANYWNPNTGQLIVDDFAEGYLYSTISNLVGSSNFDNISSIIVKGRVNSSDFGGMRNSSYTNLASLDITRIDGITELPSWAFENSHVGSIYLPACLTSIGYSAFYGCDNLNTISVYAMVPPNVTSSTFSGFTNKDNCVVRVPSEAISLYEAAPYWNDFTILPLAEELHALQVSLPDDCSDGRYKNNRIELVNIATGGRQKYVITDRLAYTFIGLLKDDQYNVYLLSQTGLEIGRIENILMQDADMDVKFSRLKTLKNASVAICTPDGTDVTSQADIEWYEPKADGTVAYLRKAATLGEVPVGQKLLCRVTLPQQLGVVYANPADQTFDVSDETSAFSIALQPLRTVTLSGEVVDENGAAVNGASVSVNAMLNGRFSTTVNAKSGRDGKWTATLLDALEYRLTYSAQECVNVLDTVPALAETESELALEKVTMRSIASARVQYSFTYMPAHKEGADAEFTEYYNDYKNVTVSVYNLTQNRPHQQLSLQYPTIVILDENVKAGDRLQLTAHSTTGAFNDIVKEVTVSDDQRAAVQFNITGKGGIEARFSMTENPAVIAMLYNANGALVKTVDYSEAVAKFNELADGEYSIVSIGKSSLLNGVQRLATLSDVGLVAGTDYVLSKVSVKEGIIAEVKNELVPPFDENRFCYTTSTTSFSVNKSSVTPGNYLTLRSTVDFKAMYKSGITDVKMIYDLPDNCEMVTGSVMKGNQIIPYEQDGKQIIVPLGNMGYTEQVRFVVVPISSGELKPTCTVSFISEESTMVQPIGTVRCLIQDFDVNIPTTTATLNIQVNGVAPKNAAVNIYDGDDLIGQTKALANGMWSASCQLTESDNLSVHPIHANIISTDGFELKTASYDCSYDRYMIYPKTVLMTFFNGWLKRNVDVVFNFENNTIENSSYMFYTTTDITFEANFTNNSPEAVSSVVLYVMCSDGTEKVLVATYDEKRDRWIATSVFDWNTTPVNLAIEYRSITDVKVDRQSIDGIVTAFTDGIGDNVAEYQYFQQYTNLANAEDLIEINNKLDNLLSQEIYSCDEVDSLLSLIQANITPSIIISDEEIDNIYTIVKKADDDWELSYANESIYDSYATFLPYKEILDFDFNNDLESEIIAEDYSSKYIKKRLTTVNEVDLITDGYETILLSNGTKVYYKFDNSCISFIDPQMMDEYDLFINDVSSSHKKSPRKIKLEFSNEFRTEIDKFKKNLSLLKTIDVSNWSANNESAISKINSIISIINGICKPVDYLCNHACDEIEYQVKKISNQLSKAQDKLIADNESLLAAYYDKIAGHNTEIRSIESELKPLYERNQRISQLISSGVDSDLEKTLLAEAKNNLIQIENKSNRITFLKGEISKLNELCKPINASLSKLKFAKLGESEILKNILNKISEARSLTASGKIGKATKIIGKLAGPFGVIVEGICYKEDLDEMAQRLSSWEDLLESIDRKIPCEGNESEALALQLNIIKDAERLAGKCKKISWTEGSAFAVDLVSLIPAIGANPYAELAAWFVSGILNSVGEWTKALSLNREFLDLEGDYWIKIMNLKCGKDDDKDKKKKKKKHYPFPPMNPIHDPSGYVYEAVHDNRVEGVQATIYYKETVEDMYGDLSENIVLWDAEEYAQKNPLFTDENGMYAWDVPQGLWQVKFEKDGYVTTQSEWLPVPPPQLEVNIPIVQNKQPEVVDAHAYETGIQFTFDKYMQPSTLNSKTVYLTVGGKKVAGKVVTIEQEGAEAEYATVFRFIPEERLSMSQGEIRLTVSREVKSYAGIPMEGNYSQVFDIEKEITDITTDGNVQLLYGGDKTITVNVIPFDASVGKTLRVKNSSPSIMTVESDAIEIDENGQAQVTLTGDLPGQAMLTFSVDDAYTKGEAVVNVVTELYNVEKPVASRASGTEVYSGTKITLTTDVPNATIYYTTDGTCPCDENGTRKKHILPIEVNGETTIKAIVTTPDGEESEIAEFHYKLKRTDIDYTLSEGWTWISHNLDTPVNPTDIGALTPVQRIVSQTAEIIRDPQYGLVGTLKEMPAEQSYKVQTNSATEKLRLTDLARNPAAPIAVSTGWNWLGYTSGQTMSVNEALSPTKSVETDYIVGQRGFAQFNGTEWEGTLENLVPGCGYMFYSQNDKRIVYNTSIVSQAAAAASSRMFSASSPWAVEINKYPQIMCMVVNLADESGNAVSASDYHFGAFSGSECRGIAKVVNGKYMMNVYGKAGDPIEFRVVPVDGDSETTLAETLNLAETMIGSVNQPHVMHIANATTVAAASADTWRLNVVGHTLHIAGGDTGSITSLSVINLDGIKVFETTSAATGSVALPTIPSGIYIVAIVENGRYSYHKIPVK